MQPRTRWYLDPSARAADRRAHPGSRTPRTAMPSSPAGPLRRALPLLAALLLALAPRPSAAQEMGSLEGTVRDVQGAPLPGAQVQAELQGAAFRRGAVADAAGRYRLTGLPGGRYRLTVRHLGYATAETAVNVGRGEARGQDFVLRVRALVVDTVTVTSRNPAVISREDTEFPTVVSEAAIRLLPLRPEVRDVVALTPGARPDQVWGGATQQANNYQIDGLAANHPGVGGDLVQPSLGWIESVEVRGLGAAAEHGNFQGGLINLVTKTGTNRFEGQLRTAVDASALSASNLQQYDVASETDARYDLEGEVRGPIRRDRLFYYAAGQVVSRTDRVVNHLRTRDGFFAPDPVESLEARAFGKLSWLPTSRDHLTLSGGYTDVRTDRFGANGYEQDAFVRATAPTFFATGLYTRSLGGTRVLETSLGGFTRDERRDPLGDADVPGVLLFGQGERPAYNAAAFRTRMAPSALTGTASLAWEMRTGPLTHRLKVGGELSSGQWIHERLRNGGMTWRPGFGRFYEEFDPQNTQSWLRSGSVPLAIGGEVRLHADVRNGAAFVQDHIDIGSRISLSPGVRLGWWTGYLTPAGDVGPRFRAVRDQAFDPRLGLTLDITGRNDLVLKGHWGRYHQSLFAQFYDRADGGNVFQNEQLWYYFGTPASPTTTFSQVQRDQLALSGQLQLQEETRLNQTGPVENYRQPYVDQLVVGVEKQLGRWWKAEATYINRRNENMVALIDRNAAANWSSWENVAVFDAAGEPILHDGQPVVLPRLYLPNYMIVDHLRNVADRGMLPLPPGMVVADTLRLGWDPDYVLTTAPEARRTFHQAQLVVRMGHPRHGGTVSFVWTSLQGNLDNVSGYDESALFAGPYVNPNQAVNYEGWLPNSSQMEFKLWLYGALPYGFRGGIFSSQRLGDRLGPTFNVSSFYTYRMPDGEEIYTRLVVPANGQPMYLQPRGTLSMPFRSLVDLHLERGLTRGGMEWLVSVDAFNVLGADTPVRYNTLVNGAIAPGSPIGGGVDPELEYAAVRERVRPRSLRLGAAVRF
jgi:Carboxypeptidase regulatory-like domain